VLILTTFDHDEYVYEAMRAGAGVTRILAKLGVRDRGHGGVTAYESGLIQPGAG
jgi:hypothetical protein